MRGVDRKKLDMIASMMENEMVRASLIFGKIHDSHHGYAIIKEELDELWDAVKTNKDRTWIDQQRKMMAEAIQIGAMAMRFVHDLIEMSIVA